MNKLKAGYASVKLAIPEGAALAGYFVPRFVKGEITPLTANTLALECDGKKIAFISVDTVGIPEWVCKEMREAICERCGELDGIIISATHTHTAPFIDSADTTAPDDVDEVIVAAWRETVINGAAEATKLAFDDISEAKMGYATAEAPPRVAYIRRYRMKDGGSMTCPPINDEGILHPIGELDNRIHILRFKRERGDDIIFFNFGLHSDCTNGELISADWPYYLKETLSLALGGVKTFVAIGAEGDVGSTHVNPDPCDMNENEISFDNEMKSPGMARFVGRALAGAVLTVFDRVTYVDVESIDVLNTILSVPANIPNPEDIPLAKEYKKLHEEGRDDLIPYEAMELTTVVAEALRMCRLENGPENFELPMSALRIGSVALVSIPGEPFTDIGVGIKEAPGFDMIMPMALTNGYAGYFPMMSAFDEGGYESRSSDYKPGVAEKIIDCGRELLSKIRT